MARNPGRTRHTNKQEKDRAKNGQAPPSLQLMRKQPGAQHGGIETPGLVRTAQQTVKGKPGRTTPRRTSNIYKLFGVLLTNTGGDWQDRQTAARRTHTKGPGIPPAATRTKSPREASRTIHTYTHTHVTTHPHEYTPTHNNTHAFFFVFFYPKRVFFFFFIFFTAHKASGLFFLSGNRKQSA